MEYSQRFGNTGGGDELQNILLNILIKVWDTGNYLRTDRKV